MSRLDPLAMRATALLTAVASGDTTAAREYDELLFPVLVDIALRRGRFLAAGAAARAGAGNPPPVRPADLEEVAADAAFRALTRARASALRFDPAKGDGATWAIGALGTAYLDAARSVTRSRRVMREVPLATIHEMDPLAGSAADPATLVVARDGLRRALDTLTDDERAVAVMALQHGMTYREIATYLFDDPAEDRKVERLLGRARRKLRSAHQAWLSDS